MTAAVLAIVLGPGTVRTRAADARDLGAEVRGIFAKKCAGCHGPDLPKPKARFGYVTDLKRVAGNPEMVIRGKPDESELWVLIHHGDMPPADSSRGPLSAAEKDTVREWITAGAPDVRAPTAAVAAPAPAPEEPAPAPVSLSPTDRAVRFLGKFHLLLLHFPIALLVAAGVAEVLASWRGSREPSPTVQFCLALAAVTVVPTVILGWLYAASGNGFGSLLTIHRWLGTSVGVWVIGTALYAWRDAHRGKRSWVVRIALAIGIALIAYNAHVGGLLVHGRDFFDW
jgi:mono/diheme cytochrome c family protein